MTNTTWPVARIGRSSLKTSTSSAKNCMSLQFDLDVPDQTISASCLVIVNDCSLVGLPDLAAAGGSCAAGGPCHGAPARQELSKPVRSITLDGSATTDGVTAEYHGPAVANRADEEDRAGDNDETRRRARARATAANGSGSTSTGACVERASSASASAPIARGVGAVVQIVNAATGASASSISRDILVAHRAEDQRRRRPGWPPAGRPPARVRRPDCARRRRARCTRRS